jgi:hypothetical protein
MTTTGELNTKIKRHDETGMQSISACGLMPVCRSFGSVLFADSSSSEVSGAVCDIDF